MKEDLTQKTETVYKMIKDYESKIINQPKNVANEQDLKQKLKESVNT